jgi:hypothetical protein
MTYDDPNRQAVGLDPISSAAGGDAGGQATTPAAAGFDPSDHTVAEVQQYLADHPDDTDRVVELERAGKNRAGIVGE